MKPAIPRRTTTIPATRMLLAAHRRSASTSPASCISARTLCRNAGNVRDSWRHAVRNSTRPSFISSHKTSFMTSSCGLAGADCSCGLAAGDLASRCRNVSGCLMIRISAARRAWPGPGASPASAATRCRSIPLISAVPMAGGHASAGPARPSPALARASDTGTTSCPPRRHPP